MEKDYVSKIRELSLEELVSSELCMGHAFYGKRAEDFYWDNITLLKEEENIGKQKQINMLVDNQIIPKNNKDFFYSI